MPAKPMLERSQDDALLKCQQCKGPLDEAENHLYCSRCDRKYPIFKNLVFMGFNKSEGQHIKTIMAAEKVHQTDLSRINEDLEFTYPSFKLGKLVVNNVQSVTRGKPYLKVLDIGAGAGAMSWLFAKNGFNTWLCELEPNSLFSGSVYQHTNLSLGKRIVCDATILPFENGTFDVVFCKEFAHHVKNINALIEEANRVLKSNGYFILIEPVLSLHLFFYLLIHPDEHTGHSYHSSWKYFELLKKKCFTVQKFGLYFYREQSKMGVMQKIKQRYNKELISGILASRKILKYLYATIVGGTIVIFANKLTDIKVKKSMPLEIEIIPTEYLVLDENYLQKVKLFYTLVQQINDEFAVHEMRGINAGIETN